MVVNTNEPGVKYVRATEDIMHQDVKANTPAKGVGDSHPASARPSTGEDFGISPASAYIGLIRRGIEVGLTPAEIIRAVAEATGATTAEIAQELRILTKQECHG